MDVSESATTPPVTLLPNPRTETSILGIPRNPNSLIYNHQISHCDQETMTRHAEPDGADIKG